MGKTQTKPTTTAADVVNDLREVTLIYGDDVLQSIIDNLDDDAPEDLYHAYEMLEDLYGAVQLAFVHLHQLIDPLDLEAGGRLRHFKTGGKTA